MSGYIFQLSSFICLLVCVCVFVRVCECLNLYVHVYCTYWKGGVGCVDVCLYRRTIKWVRLFLWGFAFDVLGDWSRQTRNGGRPFRFCWMLIKLHGVCFYVSVFLGLFFCDS